MPATTFHWIRVQTFCYATERKELLEEVMEELLGDAEYSEEPTESEHGNTMTILEARLTKQRQFRDLFERLGRSGSGSSRTSGTASTRTACST